MRIAIYYPGCCQNCGKSVPLEEAKYGKVDIPGGYRISMSAHTVGMRLTTKWGLWMTMESPFPPKMKEADT